MYIVPLVPDIRVLRPVSAAGGQEYISEAVAWVKFDQFPCLCCRNHATLNSFQAIAAVRRIVLGYGRRNPDVPFTRNLNFVVAFLLAVLGLEREEDVFWILAALLEQCLHPSCVLEVSLYVLCSSLS